MGKFLKTGKVCLMLQGRFAGRKAVIIQNTDSKSKTRAYGHSLVAGIDKYPLKINKSMNKKRMAFRSRVRPFLKIVNHNHLMPTRYNLDLPASDRKVIDVTEAAKKAESKKVIRKLFRERYTAGKNKWFFQKLRF